MFNLSGSEIIVILVLALVVLGPDKLPDAMRKAGRTWAELKKLSTGFQDEVRKGFEEPVSEVKKTADTVRAAASFNPKKLRYNPAVDPPPSLPPGESVAAPEAPAVAVAPTPDEPVESPVDPPAAAVGAVGEVAPPAEHVRNADGRRP